MLYKTLFLLSLLVVTQHSCYLGFEDQRGPGYDIREILVGQNNVYFKREIRGRNYEGFSVSIDGNLCNGPSPRTDFFLDSLDFGRIFYKVEGDELHIYSHTTLTPPQTDIFPVKIVQKEYPPPAQFNEERIKKQGYVELVFKNETLEYCN